MTGQNNQFLNPVSTNGKIFDRTHAARLFVADNYKLAPKYSFLYYVKFDQDERISRNSNSSIIETGKLVQSVSLPKFSVDNKILNSYNRPNNIQTKLKYDPVNITFHDDSNNTVLDFWRDYYDYHYRDGDYKGSSDSTTSNYQQKHKYNFNNSAPLNSWGYSLRNKSNDTHYLKNIRIYSLNRGTFTEYILVNPIITSFQHGQHTAGENSPMTHTMTVNYEAVLYYWGFVTEATIPGMLDLHYDRRPSSLTPNGLGSPGGTGGFARPRVFGARGVFGNGGILSTTDQIIGDIGSGNLGGAITKGFKAFQNNKGVNLKDIAKMEAKQALIKGILTQTNPFSGVNIPVISNLAKGVGGAVEEGADWASKKFGVKQAAQDAAGSKIGAGYAKAAAAGTSTVSYDTNSKLQQNNSAGENGLTSNGVNVSTNKPGENVFNSPTYRLPKDTSADINADFQPVQLNGSVQGPNNAASLRAAQDRAAGNSNAANPGTPAAGVAFNQGGTRPSPASDAGSNYEPQTGGTGASSYIPYYARPMNNPPRQETSSQGTVNPERKAAPIPGLQGGGGTII